MPAAAITMKRLPFVHSTITCGRSHCYNRRVFGGCYALAHMLHARIVEVHGGWQVHCRMSIVTL